MPSKNIPPRNSRAAEEYARKVRMEPAKATRQEDPLVDRRQSESAPKRRKVRAIGRPQAALRSS